MSSISSVRRLPWVNWSSGELRPGIAAWAKLLSVLRLYSSGLNCTVSFSFVSVLTMVAFSNGISDFSALRLLTETLTGGNKSLVYVPQYLLGKAVEVRRGGRHGGGAGLSPIARRSGCQRCRD